MSVVNPARRRAVSRVALIILCALALAAAMPQVAMAYELAGITSRVSVASTTGAQANNASASSADWGAPSVSENGRYVAFCSAASNLVPGDTNGQVDVFRRDLLTGETILVSRETRGYLGNGASTWPSISADGNRIAFVSAATNLVVPDTNGMRDIFIHDVDRGETFRVSLSNSGGQAEGGPGAYGASSPAISANGQTVAYRTDATNAVGLLDVNQCPDVILYDAAGGQSTVSLTTAGNQVADTRTVSVQSVSDDGRYVVFDSTSPNLVAGDTNGVVDVFLRDIQTNTTTRVSLDQNGSQLAAGGHSPSISADGRYVAFVSGNQIYHRSLTSSWFQTSSRNGYGQFANAACTNPHLSADGVVVTFASAASNLASRTVGTWPKIYYHSAFQAICWLVSMSSYEDAPFGASTLPAISGDARTFAWSSVADNLVAGDTNKKADVFVRALDATATALPKAKAVGTPVAPATMYKGHAKTIYGYVYPRHTSGTYLVTLQFFKKNSAGAWVYDHSVYAKRSTSYATKTKYSASTSLASKGKWRVRAMHWDATHAPTYSGFDYITVK